MQSNLASYEIPSSVPDPAGRRHGCLEERARRRNSRVRLLDHGGKPDRDDLYGATEVDQPLFLLRRDPAEAQVSLTRKKAEAEAPTDASAQRVAAIWRPAIKEGPAAPSTPPSRPLRPLAIQFFLRCEIPTQSP